LIKEYRAELIKSLLASSLNNTLMSRNAQPNYKYNKKNYPELFGNKNNHSWYKDSSNVTNQRLNELAQKMDQLHENINRIFEFNRNSYDQHVQIQQMIMQQDHDDQLH
jgi:hypothetical protein